MVSHNKKKISDSASIALNRKARHDYSIESEYEAGVVLLGWEVKAIREGRVQLSESHVIFRLGEAYLLNCHIAPTAYISTHVVPDEARTRKLLLNKRELNKLAGQVTQQGYTVVPLSMYWKANRIKLQIALAKGKKLYDKRADLKDRDWARQKERLRKNAY